MVGRYVLDTDTLSLYQRGNAAIKRRLMLTKPSDRFVTVITVEEQMEGRLSYLRAVKTREEQVRAYRLLAETASGWGLMQILPFESATIERYEYLWSLKLNVAKYDLRIAAIALEYGAMVIKRNRRDFARVPDLAIEAWSA